MPLFTGVVHLGAGLSVGSSGLAAGFAIGIAGEAGVRGAAVQPRLFFGMIFILIFAEVLGIYSILFPCLCSWVNGFTDGTGGSRTHRRADSE
ncbi:unnamed protein product [Rhizoctonia solani]|uniref:V-ATPase proteolipid subunit C-like domain-containing protein n=1 Tax=Rhizoctonia solani TaxID=456999 RepID=A0A8H3AIT4_9AGAM|nr:unnamed protein product [Rhizoctonia solani]